MCGPVSNVLDERNPLFQPETRSDSSHKFHLFSVHFLTLRIQELFDTQN